jgi:hypothetical protein
MIIQYNKRRKMKNKANLLIITALLVFAMIIIPLNVMAEDATPAITLTVTADKSSPGLGQEITYTYKIVNPTSDNVTGLTLVNDKLGNITINNTTLAASDNMTGTRKYTIMPADYPGPVVNKWAIAGKLSDNRTFSAAAETSLSLTPYKTALEITKTADKAIASPKEVITYTFTIKNSGDVELTALALIDNKLGNIPLAKSSLAPGSSVTATSKYTVTLTDLPGPIVNTATATAKDPAGNAITAASAPVTVKLKVNKELLTKAEILKLKGVPGKGIDKAPGLQKLFNGKSKADEHSDKTEHGKLNGKGKNGNNNSDTDDSDDDDDDDENEDENDD